MEVRKCPKCGGPMLWGTFTLTRRSRGLVERTTYKAWQCGNTLACDYIPPPPRHLARL